MKPYNLWVMLLMGLLSSCDNNQTSSISQNSSTTQPSLSERASSNESLQTSNNLSSTTVSSSSNEMHAPMSAATKSDDLLMENLLSEDKKPKSVKKKTYKRSNSMASASDARIITIDELMSKTPWVVVGSSSQGTAPVTKGTVSKPETNKRQEPPRVVINKNPESTNSANVLRRDGKDDVFKISEIKPAYPGGEKAMMGYLSKNIRYPQTAKEDGIEGTVFVQFVVEKDGSITDVNVVKGIHSALDSEAKRVVSKMPSWQPGKQNGTDVAVQYTLPVRFELIK
jgi:TonB family protein